MSPAATAPKPKSKTKKKVSKVRFVAPGEGAVVTMKNQDEVISEKGVKVTRPNTGHRIVFNPDGFGGQFYESTNEDEIEFLRERANMFGVITEMPIPKPDSSPVLVQIIKHMRAGDTDALVALAQEEEETHEREDVIEAIADALEALKD